MSNDNSLVTYQEAGSARDDLSGAGHVRVVGCGGASRRRGHVSGYDEAEEVQVRCAGELEVEAELVEVVTTACGQAR